MQIKTYTVNKNGLNEIKKFLSENHKLGGNHFTTEMLNAWAADAEFQTREGNPASIEIRGFDSVDGTTKEYTISDNGLDSEIIEIEE